MIKVNDTLYINKDRIDLIRVNTLEKITGKDSEGNITKESYNTYTVFIGNKTIELTEEEYNKIK